MRNLVLAAAAAIPVFLFAADHASAQPYDAASGTRLGGMSGFHGGGMRAGGFGGGMRHGLTPGFRAGPGFAGRGFSGGFRPGGPVAGGWRGRPSYPGGYYGYGRRGHYPAYGLATGLALGAVAAYPYYYDAPVYPAYPAYPVYEAYPARSALGGYCETPVRTCQLINPAGIGGGCSCKVAGGRARGVVIGP